jgi:autotransporter-associated beta strand protein
MTVAAVAVLWGAGTAKADIAVLDVPTNTALREGTTTPATILYTVSPGANVLVVELAQKAPTLTPTFSWGGNNMNRAATAVSDGTIRQVSIFYLLNPGAGTSNLVGSSLSTTYWSMNAFTLSGVDTSAGKPFGTGFVTGSHSNVSTIVNSVAAGSAAVTVEACNNDYMVSGGSPNPFNGFTFTGTGGTASTLWTNNSAGTTTTISGGGLITNLTAGTATIAGTILPPGGTNYVRNVLATVVFASLGAAPAPVSVMSVQGNSTAITNGATPPTTANYTDFGSTNVATGTVVRTFTILNTGDAVLNLTGSPTVAVSGAQAAEFTVTSQPATPVAVSNGTTTFQVTFAPAAPGLRSATLSIANDNPTNNPYAFAIQGTGTGTGPLIGVQGNSIAIANGDATPLTTDGTDFGVTNAAGGAVTHTFAILNTGDAALTLTASPKVAVSGAQASDFTVTAQPSTPVAATNGTTTFQVTFAPSAPGLRSATLNIANNNVSNNPYVFAIQGTGQGTYTLIPMTAKWSVGGSSIGWDATTSWSTVNTNSTPHPASVPGAADTVVFNADWQNTPLTVYLNANQAASGLVFRSTGTITIPGVNVNAANYGSLPSLDTLTLGTGGIRINPGAGLVQDDISGNNLRTGLNSLALTLTADQSWIGPYGNSLLLYTTPVDGGGHNLTLVRDTLKLGNSSSTWSSETIYSFFANMPSITLAEGATLGLYSLNDIVNTNRIPDVTDIISYGGSISYPIWQAPGAHPRSETVHALLLNKGEFDHQQDGYPNLVNVFAYAGGLTRTGATATLVFSDNGNPGHNYLGAAGGTANRVILGGQPDTNFIAPWAIVAGYGFAGHSSTVDNGYPIGVYANGGTAWNASSNDASGIYSTVGLGTVSVGYANPVVKALIFGGSMDLASNRLTITSGGLLFPSTGAGDTIYDGTVTAGTGSDTNLYVFTAYSGANNQKVIGATIADNGAGKVGLVKSGAFVLTLTNANTYSGNTTINNGTLYLSTVGSIVSSPVIELLYGNFAGQYYAGQAASGARLDVSAQTSPWTLGASQTLKGNGVVLGNVNVSGTVAPGADTGMLTVTGNVTFANNASLKVNIQNAQNAGDVWGSGDTWNVGYGRLQVYGAVNLGANAILNLAAPTNATLSISNRLFIVTGASSLSGQFKTPSGVGLNQGDTFTTGGRSYQISYTGKLASQATTGGNDVVLQVQALVPPKGTVLLIR